MMSITSITLLRTLYNMSGMIEMAYLCGFYMPFTLFII